MYIINNVRKAVVISMAKKADTSLGLTGYLHNTILIIILIGSSLLAFSGHLYSFDSSGSEYIRYPYGKESEDYKKDIDELLSAARNEFEEGDKQEAFKLWQSASDKGSGSAKYHLAECYEQGNGTQINLELALLYYAAAKDIMAEADYQSGIDYLYGYNGNNVRERAAFESFFQSAMLGNIKAMRKLAWCFEHGFGVKKNRQEARIWNMKVETENRFKKIFPQGYGYMPLDKPADMSKLRIFLDSFFLLFGLSMYITIFVLRRGRGSGHEQYSNGRTYFFKNKYKNALKWLKMAEKHGNAEALTLIGYCYYYGLGVSRDYSEAYRYYHLAADKGVINAQYLLGIAYETGDEVTKDIDEAVSWYLKCAEQGHAGAQYRLGCIYLDNTEQYHNPATAHEWFMLSAATAAKTHRKNPNMLTLSPEVLEEENRDEVMKTAAELLLT